MKLFDRSTKAGFTLVELIIVIAILAILAGIAIPVYNGYIKKANKAGDLQLLDAVNAAFAAACLENGFDAVNVASASLTGDKTVTGVEGVTLKSGVTPVAFRENNGIVASNLSVGGASSAQLVPLAFSSDAVNASFQKYFAGNEETELKTFKASEAVFANGVFTAPDEGAAAASLKGVVDNGDGTKTYTFDVDGKEVAYTIADDDIAAFKASTFGTNMTMGELMGDVTGMVDAMSTALNGGSVIANLLTSDGSALEDWGVTAEAGTDEYKNQLSNAAVMLVAKNTTADTATSLVNALSSGDINSLMSTSGGYGSLLSNMAGLYGIATSFANSDAASDWSITVGGSTMSAPEYYSYVNDQIVAAASSSKPQGEKLTDITNALGLMTAYVYNDPTNTSSGLTTAFTTYATPAEGASSSQLADDVNGYVSAMSAISGNTDALVGTGAISDGFDSPAITAILNNFFGS